MGKGIAVYPLDRIPPCHPQATITLNIFGPLYGP